MTGADPRAELASLAAGLRSQVRQGRLKGVRSTERAAGPEPEPIPAAPAPRAPRAAPAPEPPARTVTPAGPGGAPRRKRSDAPKKLTAAQRAVEREAESVRERAAACADLESLRAAVAECTSCGLCRTRTQTVFSDGKGTRPVLFVGEAPGFNEDEQGVPFVGRAGALLTDIITKGMGLAREEVTIVNVLKCRPPENRDPTESEKRTCTPWLDRQIELLDPKVIIPLGRHAACHVLGTQSSMGALRGRVHELGGRKVVATYHPAYLLRSPGMKKECWKDIKLAMGELGLPNPGSKSDAGGSAG